jgi:hypothetical protein
MSSVLLAAVSALSSGARAQSSSDELRCALLGAERAEQCLRAVAERASGRELERSVSLFVRTGDVERAAQEVERAFARGERSRVWPAMLAIGRERRERREHRAALDWYERWRDRAKRDATPDVLAAVHTGAGHAQRALDAPRAAYESFRLAVHVWRAEHAYKLDTNGEVLNEHEGQRGYVAPALLSFEQLTSALALARAGVQAEDKWACVEQSGGHEGALRRCVRALRALPPPRLGFGVVQVVSEIVSPFGALTQGGLEQPVRSAHRTRSGLDDEAFQRGNTAAGEALLGMVAVTYSELSRVTIPVYRDGSARRAFDAWARTTVTPRVVYWRHTLEMVLTPLAQQAIATRVTDVELGAAQVLADAYGQFARLVRDAPEPPDWSRPGEPYETLRAEW